MTRTRLAVYLLLAVSPLSFAQKKPVTIDDLVKEPAPLHGAITWAPDGERFIENNGGKLFLYDVRSGKQREVISLDKLHSAAATAPQSGEYEWTDSHVTERELQWFADDKRLLVSAGGDLFILDTGNGRFQPLTQTPEIEHDPKLSPDDQYVSFRRGADLYTIELASRKEARLTANGSSTLLNGETDWVYPEELDVDTAHWWSPDSRWVAYLQFDVAREPLFPQISLLGVHGVYEPERYPKPGDPNAEVRLGVVARTGGETKWMNLGDTRGFLLARAVWSPSSREIMAERLNRVQNKLDLLMANVSTGIARPVLHEEDPYWINVVGEPRFLHEGNWFLWMSERTGFRHIYLYGVDGQLQKQLTSGNWEVQEINAIDEAHNRIFFTSNEQSPLEHNLYAVSLEGTGKQRLTRSKGTHSVLAAPVTLYYLDDYSNLADPPHSTLYKPDGAELRSYRSSSTDFDILPTEMVNLKASDGTLLYARMIKPAGFQQGRKYPAVVIVYGGPGVQMIQDAWQGLSWDQVLAHQGFVIWQLDNRGSIGRGHKFESAIYHNMGAQELKDQKEGIQYLTSQGFVDPQRIGLYGWSYGGYMTLFTITNAPGLIKAAIAGDPVTNWRNYDTIYTERYMGLPEENEEGYRVSSPVVKAAGLQGTKLLMIHNIEDDNVHFQNSLQMADALERAGKQFSMLVYPQKTHHVSGPAYKQLFEETTAFFEENLK